MQLTEKQAYIAMYAFLDKQYSNGWQELGGLLGSMSLLLDGSPADPAFATEWLEAVNIAASGEAEAALRSEK